MTSVHGNRYHETSSRIGPTPGSLPAFHNHKQNILETHMADSEDMADCSSPINNKATVKIESNGDVIVEVEGIQSTSSRGSAAQCKAEAAINEQGTIEGDRIFLQDGLIKRENAFCNTEVVVKAEPSEDTAVEEDERLSAKHFEELDVYVKEEIAEVDESDVETVVSHDCNTIALNKSSSNNARVTIKDEQMPVDELQVISVKHLQHSDVILKECSVLLHQIPESCTIAPPKTSVRGLGVKRFHCDKCSYAGNSLKTLQSHILKHSGKKRFQCEECSYTCTRLCHLTSHKRIHTGEKPFHCNECNISFRHLVTLNNHKRIHLGEKPFKCDKCSYACVQMSSLNSHKLIHSEIKPFGCNLCSYTCRQLCNLSRHKRKHSGEKPFKCDLCSYSCKQVSNLNNHKRTHSGEHPFKCDVCSYSSKRLRHLKSHKLTQHLNQ